MAKVIGGIFLIVGISIGAGILALPVTTSTSGFFPSSALLFFCWLLMTFNALLVLEINLWLPENSNIISMAGATLGKWGQVIAWLSYCLLLYTLLSAYISAGTDMLGALFARFQLTTLDWLNSLIFTGILGYIVFRGTKAIDYVNRGLIITKLLSFLLLLLIIMPVVKMDYLLQGQSRFLPSTLMIVIASYGFATIVPSLRTYFNSDVRKLRKVILIGSVIPLLCYVIWDLVILGALPLDGSNGLIAVLSSGKTTSRLILALHHMVGNHWVGPVSTLFSSICVATSFLGVALSLSDFLADGLSIAKTGRGSIKLAILTFLLPLLVVIFYPEAFIQALSYAGVCCTVLLAVLPSTMAWFGRYRRGFIGAYQAPGGKPLIILSLLMALGVLLVGVLQLMHMI